MTVPTGAATGSIANKGASHQNGVWNPPRALIGHLRGENFGKLLVRVAANDTRHQH